MPQGQGEGALCHIICVTGGGEWLIGCHVGQVDSALRGKRK